jgi:2-methylcitrate dehydratase PrpD
MALAIQPLVVSVSVRGAILSYDPGMTKESVVIGSSKPSTPALVSSGKADLLERVAPVLASLEYDRIPAKVVACTKRLLIDSLAVAAAGASSPGVVQVLEQVREWGGKPESGLLYSDFRLPAPWAALANAAMIHGRDFDETHDAGAVHSFAPVVPAALAAAEKTGASGKDLLVGVIAGTEFVCRLALSFLPHQVKQAEFSKWHFASICGCLGAAAAAARVMLLPEPQLRNAIGIALSLASGSRQPREDGALTKRLQPAFASMNGVTAATLAARGVTGATHVFEGKFGFYELFRQHWSPRLGWSTKS